jgi:hypothetical protein
LLAEIAIWLLEVATQRGSVRRLLAHPVSAHVAPAFDA